MDEISALKASLIWWDTLGDVSAFLVLLGVILESVTQFEWLSTWSGLSKIPQWHRPIGQAGAALLIAGLASEMISARRSHNINDQITANLTNHAARLTAETESARAGIAVANARAAQARVREHRLGAGHGGGREVEPLGLEMPSIVYGT